MKKWFKNLIYILPAFVLFAVGCEPVIDVPAPASGTVDFSNYIAVGNSLTAGFSDAGLYANAQSTSFPQLIAQQMQQVTPADFTQPDIPGNGSGYLYVQSLDLSGPAPDVEFNQYPPDAEWLNQLTGTFNNLGVPGIRVKDIAVNGYGASPEANPYFYRMLGGKSAAMSYLDLVTESNPTFFTCWMGNNDVLGYASSGGVAGIDGAPVTGLGGLTNPAVFGQLYGMLVDALTEEGGSGVLVTIPDITLAPYFTTVPWNFLELDAATATLANGFYSAGIDTAVETKVQEAVIALTVTEKAVAQEVIPPLAEGTVYQTAYTTAYLNAIDSGQTPEEAAATATQAADDYVASQQGMAEIDALSVGLNANLRAHLLGEYSGSLEPLYDIIDLELANNPALQEGIAQGIADLTYAYENELLPPADQNALSAAIAQGTQDQITLLKAAGIYPVFSAGPNGFVIEVPVSETNPLGIRQMVEGEYVLLTAMLDGELTGLNALQPKANQYILTLDEVKNINDYTEDFNEIIRNEAASNPNIALFESNDVLERISQGVFEDGVKVNSGFLTGGAFSLDGVHLTPRGYSIVANSIIDVINSNFSSTISPVVINEYRAVVLP